MLSTVVAMIDTKINFADTTVSDALEPCQYKRHFRQTILEPEPDSDDDYHRDIEVLLDDTGHVQSSTEAGKTEEEDSGVIGTFLTGMAANG